VFIGHAEAVHCEFAKPVTAAAARDALRATRGINVVDHRNDAGYVTPAEAAGEDAVYVSRIRVDPTVTNGLAMWVVADNLRKGAALNAVQIAELLADEHLVTRRPTAKVQPLRRPAAE
jgi:aspartate-semialdehyde dehydrogenase